MTDGGMHIMNHRVLACRFGVGGILRALGFLLLLYLGFFDFFAESDIHCLLVIRRFSLKACICH